MKKFFYLGIIFILLFSCVTSDITQKTHEEILVILHTNDTHGHPLKFYNYPAPDVGGIPARATLVNEIRESYNNVLVLDAGDINTGRPESNFFKALPDIKGYNYMKYDAVVFGNHEFDNPMDILLAQMQNAKFTFISANVLKKNGEYLGKPYIIKDFGDFKVGIFGLTTKETEIVGNPDTIKELIFLDEIETAKKIVAELEDKVDVIIALTHMGIFEDSNTGSKKLAKNVKGIDLIIDGHSHTEIEKPIYINNTPIVQAWQWGLVLGKCVMKIKNKKITGLNWESIPINLKKVAGENNGVKEYEFIDKEIPEDKKILAELETYSKKVDKILSEVIGEAQDDFFNEKSRIEETPIGDLISDAMEWYGKNIGVDFAVQNGGGIRTGIPKGKITKKVIYEVIPFDNSQVVLTLTGKEVADLFNFFAGIKQGDGAFPQVSKNVSFTLNYEKQKCENILISGKPIDLNRKYKVATNSYLAIGGNGYIIFKNAKEKYDTSRFQRDVLIDYIKYLKGKIIPKNNNRIKIIGKNQAIILYRLIKVAA